jgi:hypothetical protein
MDFFHHRDTEVTEKNFSMASLFTPQGGRGGLRIGFPLRVLCAPVVFS